MLVIKVDGQHEAIISEGLFYSVRDVLAGRSRNYRPKVQTTENRQRCKRKKEMLAQITEYEEKLSNSRNFLVTEKIDVEDYNLMKSDYNSVITKLEKQLHDTNFEKGDIEDLMSRGRLPMQGNKLV